jgi:flagellar hook-associated protein 3 FlgL
MSNLSGLSELFLTDVARIQEKLADASRQISSGKRLSKASDSPDEVAPLLQLRAERARNTRIQANLSLARTDANSADETLTTAIKLMDRARVLAANGGSSNSDALSRQALAGEVQSLLEQMVSASRTSVQGRYIFSGDDDANPAYVLNLTSGNGVDQLVTAGATRRVEHPAGGAFPAGMTAQEIFDTRNTEDGSYASDNVFAALNSLRVGLLTNDTNAIIASSSKLSAASERLNRAQSFYGNVQTRIQDAESYAEAHDIRLKTAESQIEDADAIAAAVELNEAKTQLEAAFQMRAMVPNKSLFDYLG